MIRLEIESREMQKRIASLARRTKDLTPVAREWAGGVVRRIRDSFPRQSEPSEPGGPPSIHSGQRGLVGSITHNILPQGEGAEIGTPLVYGGILHMGTRRYLGGPIRPKRARALTIPLTREAKRKRARDIPGLFRVPAEPGAPPEDVGILALAGPGESIVPMYALRTAVSIDPRPWLEIVEEDEVSLVDILGRQLDREVFGG